MKLIRSLSLLIFSLVVFGAPSITAEVKTVKLQLKWKHQFQFAGYYAAIEKGYYSERGIEVELIEAESSDWPGNAVFDGRADFGTATTEVAMMRSRGKPAVVLATIFQHSAYVILGSRKAGIFNAQDLVGKRVMIDMRSPDTLSFLEMEGVSIDQLSLQPYSFSVDSILNGKIDAASTYLTDAPFILKKNGFEYTVIRPSTGGIDFYGDLLFTSQQLIEDDPDLVVAFKEASLKGWDYALQNQEELIGLIYDKYSQRHSREHLRFEAEAIQGLVNRELLEIGYTNPGRWKHIVETYENEGFIERGFNVEGLLLADYISPKLKIPWKVISGLSLAVLLTASIALILYRSKQRLQVVEADLRLNQSRLEEANQSKLKFFKIIAHDLRNPFNSLIGLSSMMHDDLQHFDKDQLASNLDRMKKEAQNTFTLLNNLLDWSSTQANTLSFEPKLLCLDQLIDDCIALPTLQAERKQISLRKHSSDTDMNLVGDENMLKTIARNLISNAIKFTEEQGQVDVYLESDGNHRLLKVADNGIGMNRAVQDNLFRIDSVKSTSGTAKETGSGLGLLLCKEFVDRHQGSIEIESAIGKGTTFTIRLPKKPSV